MYIYIVYSYKCWCQAQKSRCIISSYCICTFHIRCTFYIYLYNYIIQVPNLSPRSATCRKLWSLQGLFHRRNLCYLQGNSSTLHFLQCLGLRKKPATHIDMKAKLMVGTTMVSFFLWSPNGTLILWVMECFFLSSYISMMRDFLKTIGFIASISKIITVGEAQSSVCLL